MVFLYPQYISDDHPAVEILHVMETTAYYADKNSGYALRQYIIRDILRWANTICLKVGALYVLWFHFSETTS